MASNSVQDAIAAALAGNGGATQQTVKTVQTDSLKATSKSGF